MPECRLPNWEMPDRIRPPAAGEVIVWQVKLDKLLPCSWDDFLTAAEIVRAEQFKFAAHRQNSALRRIVLRRILSQSLHLPPNEITLTTTALGKPYCLKKSPGAPLHFNVTGRGTAVLIAVTECAEIGVDLEKKITNLAAEIAATAFTTNEQTIIADSPDPDLQTTRFWTRKEAYLKARGLGLNAEPNTCDVADITKPQEVAADGTSWRISDLPPSDFFTSGTDSAAALCIHGKNPPQQLTLYVFPADEPSPANP